MKENDVFPSRFAAAADLKGREVPLTIDRVELETFENKQKPIVFFKGAEKGLVCNKTNFNLIALIAGEDTDDWPGKSIILYPTMVDFKGETKEAIRVRRPPEPPAPVTVEAQVDDDLADEIPF